MADDGNQPNNKELVGRALDDIQGELQSIIITQMKLQYGLGWWSNIIADKHFQLPIDALSYSEIDDDTAREYMDISACFSIIKNYDILPEGQRKKCNSLLYKMKNVRNDKSHYGKKNYPAGKAREAIDQLIELNDALDLNLRDKLREYRDSVRDNDASVEKNAEAIDHVVSEIKQTPTVTLAKSVPHEIFYDIRSVCLQSCKGMLDDLTELQKNKKSKASKKDIPTTYVVKDGAYILTLQEPLTIDESTGISIDGREFSGTQVSFSDYDNNSRKVKMYPGPIVKDSIKEGSAISLISDMKWLTEKTGRFFEDYGDLIAFPPSPAPDFKTSALLSKNFMGMSPDQIGAVKTILTQPLSYVWGVPGSGKTQYVLATAINECVSRGDTVAVIAPTNNSLEQVLRGLMRSFSEQKTIDPDKDLVRIGNPTSEFLRDYPSICEDKKVRVGLTDKKAERNFLEATICERKYEGLKATVDKAVSFSTTIDDSEASARNLYDMMKPLLDVMGKDRRFGLNSQRVNVRTIKSQAAPISNMIYGRDRTRFFESDIAEVSDGELENRVSKLNAEISKMEDSDPKADIDKCKVICMTLSKFLISFGPEVSSGRSKLNVDRVFVDEAGYCNALQLLGVFTLGVPVTLLGDHMQLPPVCEVEEEKLKPFIETEGHTYDFLWDLSAIFVERFFSASPESLVAAYRDNLIPNPDTLDYTSVARLTSTHRFGQNLADSLSRCIYHAEIESQNASDLVIEVIDAHIDAFPEEVMEDRTTGEIKRGPARKNSAEKEAIASYIRREHPADYIILTPYRSQLKLLQWPRITDPDHILTIHKSQGREWDTVIVSVCDGRACNDDKPPRFTSTVQNHRGMQVINTAVSRAKRKLVLVCDTDYWTSIEGELIGDLIQVSRASKQGTGSQNSRH